MAKAAPRGSLAGRGQEHFRGRGVAVLLEEVVFDLPHVLEAQPVGQLDLFEGVLEEFVLRPVVPRTW